jgi:hypothetical protein
MPPGNLFVDFFHAQSSKKPGWPCGDVVACERDAKATTICLADGIGSGMHAHIAAEMCVSRFKELLRLGFSFRQAFARIVTTMESARDPQKPYAVLTAVKILNDGMTTALTYEMPPPLLLMPRSAFALKGRTEKIGGALVTENDCCLRRGEGIFICSDGITQAGLGQGLNAGWESEGVRRFINECFARETAMGELPRKIHEHARSLWREGGDDCTAALAVCRPGQIANLLTGPPADDELDRKTVTDFLARDGLKIVCGATTANLVARETGQSLRVEQHTESLIAPPRYKLTGIDLVTEGAVTLNQVYNLLDEGVENLHENSGVTELRLLLNVCDRVNFIVGKARNSANSDISFRQRGILNRERIVPLIAQSLRKDGKLVTLEEI